MLEILASSRSSISVKQSASCNAVYNMIREELALVKQNDAWKPRREKGWSGLFYPLNWLNFQFCRFNLISLIAPSWSKSNFILFVLTIRVGPSRSELIRLGLAVQVNWSGPTFVPACVISFQNLFWFCSGDFFARFQQEMQLWHAVFSKFMPHIFSCGRPYDVTQQVG